MNADTLPLVLNYRIRFWGRGIWISALLVAVPPMIGLIGTIIGINNAFASLGSSGIGDPAALSGHISMVLLTTMWGLIISVIGMVLLVISIVRFLKFRAELRALGAQPG